LDINIAPTKANLIKAKSFLEFSRSGFELLDKKRNVLIREMMSLMERVKDIQRRMTDTFKEAFEALQVANVSMGVHELREIGLSISTKEDFKILTRSVMGVEIPTVKYEETNLKAQYGFYRTNPAVDLAFIKFREVKYLIYEIAEIENSVYKLAIEIKKTQKRANALEKIQIPKYEEQVKYMEEVLEEKEREDFFRLKRVKNLK
jgi:V/A-type H+-transporting ATPase subunit D